MEEYVGDSPCDRVRPQSAQKKEMRTLEATEVQILLETARNSQFYPVIDAAVSSGLRRNELLGLRWRDIDLDKSSISVRRTLKESLHLPLGRLLHLDDLVFCNAEKVVSDAPGHSRVAFTMDTYAGRIPQEEAMALLNEVLPEE